MRDGGKTVRAAIYDAPGRPLRIANIPDPRPGPGQAVIRVAACGVCGSDLHATTEAANLARRGGVLGHEVTGEIIEIGPEPVEPQPPDPQQAGSQRPDTKRVRPHTPLPGSQPPDLRQVEPQPSHLQQAGSPGSPGSPGSQPVRPEPIGSRWSVGDHVYVIPLGSCGLCPQCRLERPENCPHQLTFGALGPDEPDGAYAEYLAVSLSDLLAVPASVPMDVAALSEPLATGLLCVRQAELQIGDRVLIMGGGPIGLAATIWARFFGARRVVVAEKVEQRRSLAITLGATDTINVGANTDTAESFTEITGAEPDVVIEAVGRPGMLNAAIAAVRPCGRVVTGGVCMKPDSFDHLLAYAKEPSIRTARVYTRAENEFILEMIATNRIDPSPMITHRINLDELPTAFEALRTPTNQCKVMLTP